MNVNGREIKGESQHLPKLAQQLPQKEATEVALFYVEEVKSQVE